MTSYQPTVLALFPSKSNPSKSHQVRLGADGNLYCTCPSWRFQKNSPTNRSCKHIVSFKSSAKGSHFSQGAEPVAIRATRTSKKTAGKTIPCPPPAFDAEPAYAFTRSAPTSWERLDAFEE